MTKKRQEPKIKEKQTPVIEEFSDTINYFLVGKIPENIFLQTLNSESEKINAAWLNQHGYALFDYSLTHKFKSTFDFLFEKYLKFEFEMNVLTRVISEYSKKNAASLVNANIIEQLINAKAIDEAHLKQFLASILNTATQENHIELIKQIMTIYPHVVVDLTFGKDHNTLFHFLFSKDDTSTLQLLLLIPNNLHKLLKENALNTTPIQLAQQNGKLITLLRALAEMFYQKGSTIDENIQLLIKHKKLFIEELEQRCSIQDILWLKQFRQDKNNVLHQIFYTFQMDSTQQTLGGYTKSLAATFGLSTNQPGTADRLDVLIERLEKLETLGKNVDIPKSPSLSNTQTDTSEK